MIGFDIKKSFDSFQNISHMTQNIFQILIRLIGYVCKKSEGCHIGKGLAVKPSDIAVIQFFLHDHGSSLCHILRHKQAVGKIIGTSGRDIPDGDITFFLHNPGHNLIQRSISSAAYDQVHLISVLPGLLVGVLCLLSRTDDHLIIILIKNINNIQQMGFDLSLACLGVKNKEHFLSHSPIPLSIIVLACKIRHIRLL